MLRMIWKWNVDDVGNALTCACCVCSWGCSDLVRCPWWGKIEWLKNLSIYEGMLRCFNSSMVMYLMTPMFDTLDVVYVHGGVQ